MMGIMRTVLLRTSLCLALALLSAGEATAQSVPPACASFTDSTLTTTTPIKAIHITELRTCVDAVRAVASLAAFAWTDPVLTAGATPVKAVHLSDLRTALQQAYAAAKLLAPTYTDDPIVAGVTTVRLIHIQELRTAAQGFTSAKPAT
jgi:hypothetical protein